MAKYWEVDAETTELTFFLRDDVLWHDGEPTTAYDVAFTFERATNPETGFSNASFWTHYDGGPSGVEVIDSFTIATTGRNTHTSSRIRYCGRIEITPRLRPFYDASRHKSVIS